MQKIKKYILLLHIFFMLALVGGCYYDKEELLYPGSTVPVDCNTVPAKFSADVFPLITGKCAIPGCHNSTASGGFFFQNYKQVSEAKERINRRVVIEKSMPPSGPLLPAEINMLKCWIEAGAPNN